MFVKRLLVLFLVVISPSLFASVIFHDDFSGDSLSSNWGVSYENTDGWSYDVSNGSLNVSSINGSNEKWANVHLEQSININGDFTAQMGASWNSYSRKQAMQNVRMSFFDSNAETIATVGYNDSWITERGGVHANAGINGDHYWSGMNYVPYNSAAIFSINRIDDLFTVKFGNSILMQDILDTRDIASLSISFGFYSGNRATVGNSFFGSESVDFLSISTPTSTSVPEPAPSLLFLLGLGMLIVSRFKILK